MLRLGILKGKIGRRKKSQNFHLQRNVVFDRVCGLRQAENGWKYLILEMSF